MHAAEPSAAASQASATAPSPELSYFEMSMAALAGLVLFIYGVTRLSEGLTELNTETMRRVLARFTTNRLAGVGTGIVATTLLESSSVTIIMVIAMVSGGVLSSVQSLGVVLGANIGTTVGAQIIAFDIPALVTHRGEPATADRRSSGEGSLQGPSAYVEPAPLPAAARGVVDLDAALRELRALGEVADRARTATEKADVFASVIVRCGQCHETLGVRTY